jgi:hypothetical protein
LSPGYDVHDQRVTIHDVAGALAPPQIGKGLIHNVGRGDLPLLVHDRLLDEENVVQASRFQFIRVPSKMDRGNVIFLSKERVRPNLSVS